MIVYRDLMKDNPFPRNLPALKTNAMTRGMQAGYENPVEAFQIVRFIL